MTFSDDYKMRIFTGPLPEEQDMEDLYANVAALEMAMDDADEDDEVELNLLHSALKEAISALRLNLYRAGKKPGEVM